MPGMNGLELLDRLLAAGKSIPAIVLTAFTQEADRVRALAPARCDMPNLSTKRTDEAYRHSAFLR